jgi:hypothetical protein
MRSRAGVKTLGEARNVEASNMTHDNRTHGGKKWTSGNLPFGSGTLTRLARIHVPLRRASSLRRGRSAAADYP